MRGSMNVEQLAKQLDSMFGHIRAFDSKAQVVLGIDGVLAGFVATQLSMGLNTASWRLGPLSISFIVVSGVAVVTLLTSVCYAIATVFPRLKVSTPGKAGGFLV